MLQLTVEVSKSEKKLPTHSNYKISFALFTTIPVESSKGTKYKQFKHLKKGHFCSILNMKLLFAWLPRIFNLIFFLLICFMTARFLFIESGNWSIKAPWLRWWNVTSEAISQGNLYLISTSLIKITFYQILISFFLI